MANAITFGAILLWVTQCTSNLMDSVNPEKMGTYDTEYLSCVYRGVELQCAQKPPVEVVP